MKYPLPALGLIFILGLFGVSPLQAQDFHLTEWEWIDQDDPPDKFPEFKRFKTPPVPKEIKALDSYAYAIIEGGVLKSGKWWNLQFENTHPILKIDLFKNRIKTSKPAYRGKKKVTSTIWRALIFNPKEAAPDQPNAQPRLLQVAPVVLPAEENKPSSELIAARLTLDPNGLITDIELAPEVSEDIRKASQRALQKWKFSPARAEGVPIATRIEVPLILRRDFYRLADFDADTPPIPLKRDTPVYPISQRIAGFEGEVIVEFIINVEGRVKRAFVVRSNNPAFDEPAVEAVLKWKFKPAERNGRPVNVRMQVPIIFNLNGGGSNAFSIQGSKKNQQKLPPEFQFDVAPKLLNISPAVYPYDQLLAKEKGEVHFMFAVGANGYAQVVKVFDSAGEEFTRAVTAMVDSMRFDPALKKGHPANALLAMKLKFGTQYDDIQASDSAAALLRLIRAGKENRRVASAKELDHRLIPISRKPAVFPRTLGNEIKEGNALIEFYIDHHGLAQLPRIINSTNPAFGYAACQAISAWRFKPPLRDGKSVAVKVRIPVNFKRE